MRPDAWSIVRAASMGLILVWLLASVLIWSCGWEWPSAWQCLAVFALLWAIAAEVRAQRLDEERAEAEKTVDLLTAELLSVARDRNRSVYP